MTLFSTLPAWRKYVALFAVVLAVFALYAALTVVRYQAHADDYLIQASDTIPIFTAAAAVAKTNFVSIANVGLPYYLAFMVALVILVLVLLPVQKIWELIAGRNHK